VAITNKPTRATGGVCTNLPPLFHNLASKQPRVHLHAPCAALTPFNPAKSPP
jgi:hypothetical protein